MQSIIDFILAALPWVIVGTGVAVVAVYFDRKGKKEK